MVASTSSSNTQWPSGCWQSRSALLASSMDRSSSASSGTFGVSIIDVSVAVLMLHRSKREQTGGAGVALSASAAASATAQYRRTLDRQTCASGLSFLPWGAHQSGLKQHGRRHSADQRQRHQLPHAGGAGLTGQPQ